MHGSPQNPNQEVSESHSFLWERALFRFFARGFHPATINSDHQLKILPAVTCASSRHTEHVHLIP